MTNSNIHVSCYYCHAVNHIVLGNDFYEARAFYRCGSCDKQVSLHLTQSPLETSNRMDIQIGEVNAPELHPDDLEELATSLTPGVMVRVK